MKKLLLESAVVIVTIFSSCGNSNTIEDISWMIGSWQGTDINTVIFNESWRREGKSFVGAGYSMSPAGDTLFKENLKIELVESVPYYIVTIPPKKEPVLFKLIKGDEHNAIFENRDEWLQWACKSVRCSDTFAVGHPAVFRGILPASAISARSSSG